MEQATGKATEPEKNPRPTLESRRAKIFVWVGSATALISLILGGNQVWKLVNDRILHRQQVNNLVASATLQQDARDYGAAWDSLQAAAALSSESRLTKLQEDLAMKWSEDVHLRSGETFTEFAHKVEPVLSRGVANTQDKTRKADLLAHVGWCAFLRTRDGDSTADPAAVYEQALKLDAKNPYANAMFGHWIAWRRGKLEDARSHFDAALSSGRVRQYVRDLQMSSLFNNHSDEYENEALRIANEIRKEGGRLDARTQADIFNVYTGVIRSEARKLAIAAAAPPLEQIDTLRWIGPTYAADPLKSLQAECAIAAMQEAAGQRDEARKSYASVLDSAPKYATTLRDFAAAGLKRTK